MTNINGLIEGMSNSDYHAHHDYVSSSYLKTLINSTPNRATFERLTPKESDAMAFGTAVHCAVLEPEEFARTYKPFPKIDKRTKAGKEEYEKFLSSLSQDGVAIDCEDYEKIATLVRNLDNQPIIANKLIECHKREVSIFDSSSNPKLRCRFDAWDGKAMVIDIKTMREPASEVNFRKAVTTFGYGLQAAFYRLVARRVGITINDFGFICLETTAPYEVAAFVLDSSLLDLYEAQLTPVLANLTTGGTWPDTFKVIGLTNWQMKSSELEVTF